MHNELFIGLLGRRNQGKSTLMNLLTGQEVSIVSDIPGTTTDPVKKSIEIFGLGRCVWVDTAGWDDGGVLGKARTQKTSQAIATLQAAIVVFSENTFTLHEEELCLLLQKYRIPFVLLHNKKDIESLSKKLHKNLAQRYPHVPILDFSIQSEFKQEISSLIESLKKIISPFTYPNRKALEGIVKEGDFVLLVTPIDGEAPEGRLILPQVQMARQCLDLHASCLLTQPSELAHTLLQMKQSPKLVITDSQAFKEVCSILPVEQALTSFSICLARQKGPFNQYLQGTPHIAHLQDHHRLLLLESCTHQVNCEDIGRVKLPHLLKKITGKKLEFDFVSGLSPLPNNLHSYAMVIQCGGCMVTEKQMENRLQAFIEAGIPISNYGMSFAFLQGIFERATLPFLSV